MRWALVALAIATAAPPPAAHSEQMRYVMGTLWTVEAAGPEAAEAVNAAFEEIKQLDALWSHYKPTSEISRLNREAAAGWVTVSPETAEVLAHALAYARESGGAFDPTVGPLVRLWGFKDGDYRFPEPAAIARARARVGFHHVQVEGDRVRFDAPVEVELGAIAKGTAVDRAIAVLERAGMAAGRVDAGGNQRVFGGGRQAFGVKHPREEGAVIAELPLRDAAVSTSGDAERGFWHDGVRYGHILDPHTGWPAEGLWSVTVTAPTAEEADALSTTLYVLGIERGLALLERHPGCNALFVAAGPEGPRLVPSPGMKLLSGGGG